jgi:predicted esterase YcpF (UPF0227 family)
MSGPIFLYLHGFASSPESGKARAFASWAAARGLRVERLDLRVPSFEHLRLSAMKARVREAIDAAGGPRARAVLIGSSLGGLTAARVAEEDARVCGTFLMAPAFRLAERWKQRIGEKAWQKWRETGFIEVDDHATRKKSKVDFRFVEELAEIDAEGEGWPDVRVPTCIVHGIRDDIVDVRLSREWATGRRHVRLVEVEDGHELSGSVDRILAEAGDVLVPFLG